MSEAHFLWLPTTWQVSRSGACRFTIQKADVNCLPGKEIIDPSLQLVISTTQIAQGTLRPVIKIGDLHFEIQICIVVQIYADVENECLVVNRFFSLWFDKREKSFDILGKCGELPMNSDQDETETSVTQEEGPSYSG